MLQHDVRETITIPLSDILEVLKKEFEFEPKDYTMRFVENPHKAIVFEKIEIRRLG